MNNNGDSMKTALMAAKEDLVRSIQKLNRCFDYIWKDYQSGFMGADEFKEEMLKPDRPKAEEVVLCAESFAKRTNLTTPEAMVFGYCCFEEEAWLADEFVIPYLEDLIDALAEQWAKENGVKLDKDPSIQWKAHKAKMAVSKILGKAENEIVLHVDSAVDSTYIQKAVDEAVAKSVAWYLSERFPGGR